MLLASLVMLLVLLFLLISFLAILQITDRSKLWDHAARTLVAIGVAIGTVYVAITLFQKQLDQRRDEDYQKQRQIVLSYLRSKMLEAQAMYKAKAPEIASPFIKCDINFDQCFSEAGNTWGAATAFSAIIATGASALDVGLDANRADVWQLMRLAPLIDEGHFIRIAEIFDKAQNSSLPLRRILKAIEARRTADLLAMPEKDKAEQWERLVLLQSRQIVGSLRAVCQLNHLHDEISSGTKTNYDDNTTACPPHSSTYDDFIFTYWKASRERPFKGGLQNMDKP